MRRSLRNRRAGVGYFVYEGLRGVVVHKFMSFASVTIIAACLLVTVTFSLVAYNIDLAVQRLGSLSEIMLFVDDSLDEASAKALASRIRAVDNVAQVVFVSREEQLNNFLEGMGSDAYLLEDLRQDNPLRHGFRVTMEDIALHQQTVSALMRVPDIAASSSEKDVSDVLLQIRQVVNLISYTLIGMLGAVSVFIISNTVRLALFSRREEIAIMRMVGATNHFIRAPFVVEGIALGVLAGLLAFAGLWAVYGYVVQALTLGTALFQMIDFSLFRAPLLGILLLTGALIGALGSGLSIRRFLKV